MLLTVISPTADVLGDPQEPHRLSHSDSQLLYGEQFLVEESHGAYVQGHCVHDSYPGFVERGQLVKNAPKATHIVHVHASHLYPQPDFKSRPEILLSFMSKLALGSENENGFHRIKEGQWVFSGHISPLENFIMAGDLAETAMIYLGCSYLFGGRSVFGIDCSGLVQQVLAAHGNVGVPRDTKDQSGGFGTKVDKDNLKRNDIVFFKGHVGIMIDNNQIINATARHMSTVIEKIDTLEKIYGGITHVARI